MKMVVIRKKDIVTKITKTQLSRMRPARRTIVKAIIRAQTGLYKFDKRVQRWSKRK